MVVIVEIISKELIKPSSPTPHESKDIKLSLHDQLIYPCFIPLIFIYQNPLCSDHHAKRSQHLKESLSEVLTKFYPLAGRIRGNHSIDCDDSGALFVEARVRDDLSKSLENVPIEELNQFLPLKPHGRSSDVDVPILAIQISSFECGGTAIGVCMSHKIGDASSLVTFMNAWAAISRGEPDKVVETSFDLASKLFPGIDEDSSFPSYGENGGSEMLAIVRFLFNKEKLAALRELASSAFGSPVKDPTRVESVSAYIWKQFIDISRAKGNTKSIFAATLAINLRTRMNLPFEGFTFGNVVTAASASLIFSDQEDKENDVGDLVWELRSAIRKASDDDHIKNIQSGVPHLYSLNEAIKLLSNEDINCCMFSSWCRFPIYEVDYGWGKPLSVCTSAAPTKNLVYMMSTKGGDGIEAWINMLKDEIAMLPAELLELEAKSLVDAPQA